MRYSVPTRRTGLLVLIGFLVVFFWSLPSSDRDIMVESKSAYQPIRPVLPPASKGEPDPVRWLKENSGDRHAVGNSVLGKIEGVRNMKDIWKGRPRAALISLVRNSELEGILGSMRQLEYRWNRKYQVRLHSLSWNFLIWFLLFQMLREGEGAGLKTRD